MGDRYTILHSKDYVVQLENVENIFLVHCDISNWTRDVYKRLKKEFNTLCELHPTPLYATHVKGDQKHKKFLNRFGFMYCKEIDTTIGKQDLYVRVK